MQLLDYIIVAYIVFSLKNKLPNLFPGWINCFTFPPAMYMWSSFSAPLSAFKSECSGIPFGFISLMSNYVEHSVMCFLVICVIHLSEMSLYFHLTTESRSVYHSIMLTLCDLGAVALLAPWDFPGKNTGEGCHSLLQGIWIPNQGPNLCLPRCRKILYHPSHHRSPFNNCPLSIIYGLFACSNVDLFLNISDANPLSDAKPPNIFS